MIIIDLSKPQVLQENKDLIQQINFIGGLTEAANVFIIIEKKRTYHFRILELLLMYCINKRKSKDNQFIKQR